MYAFSRLVVVSIFVVLSLTACSLHLSQEQNTALIALGDGERVEYPGAPCAERYLPYGILADVAYTDLEIEDMKAGEMHVPKCVTCLGSDSMFNKYFNDKAEKEEYWRVGQENVASNDQNRVEQARSILSNWTFIGAHQYQGKETPGEIICANRRQANPFGCIPFPGLEVQVWAKKSGIPGVCQEAAIVFRGTDGIDFDDWLSNLRWITRFIPGSYDQYDQVRDGIAFANTASGSSLDGNGKKMSRWLTFLRNKISEVQKCDTKAMKIIAVGHSLGGGLAQQAAYMAEGEIQRVIAFDSSPVTGYFSVPEAIREKAEEHLVIDRVYEHMEILAVPRWIMRQIYPLTSEKPAIQTVRFNNAGGGAITRHRLNALLAGYMSLIYEDKSGKVRDPWLKGRPSGEICKLALQ